MSPQLDAVVDTYLEFYGSEPAYVTMAPGRVEFLGNHTDYNGGCVLGMPLSLGVYAGISEREDKKIRLVSKDERSEQSPIEIDFQSFELFQPGDPNRWANYPLGVLRAITDRGIAMKRGFDIAFWSDLPAGAGLGSSAAIELATVRAISILYDLDIDDPAEIARVGRKAENNYVGVPCGIFDQGVSAYGKKGHLVYVDAKQESFSDYGLPEMTQFWLFDTKVSHANMNSMYSLRNDECLKALEVLEKTYSGINALCDLTSGQVEPCEADLSPAEFKRALHVTRENERVKQAMSLLMSSKAETLGSLLYASHESSRDLFENSIQELDTLVELLKAQPEVYGARLSGGGFGGMVLAWTSGAFIRDQAETVLAAYGEKFGTLPEAYPVESGEGARIL
ncbi:MAG: galactokinase [Verrucomicrobiota bacterium]